MGTPQAPLGVRQAGSYDMVFQTVDSTQPAGSQNSRNIEWARYCLNSTTPANEKLWVQHYTWTSAPSPASVPSTASCPDPAWGNQRVLADNLFNRNGGADRPLFTPNSTDPGSVTRVGLTAYVNANRGGAATAATREARLDTRTSLLPRALRSCWSAAAIWC